MCQGWRVIREVGEMKSEIQYNTGVYILTGSLDGVPLIKVGMTKAGLSNRIGDLRAQRYAGVDDWTLHSWLALDNPRLSSAVERIAHDELDEFNLPLTTGNGVRAKEVFDISPEAALEILNAAFQNMNGYVHLDPQFVLKGDLKRLSMSRVMVERLIGLTVLLGFLTIPFLEFLN